MEKGRRPQQKYKIRKNSRQKALICPPKKNFSRKNKNIKFENNFFAKLKKDSKGKNVDKIKCSVCDG